MDPFVVLLSLVVDAMVPLHRDGSGLKPQGLRSAIPFSRSITWVAVVASRVRGTVRPAGTRSNINITGTYLPS
jgi:hypothetical protein